MRGLVVEVSARTFDIPYECPCCGAEPDAEVAVTAKASGRSLLFPYCKRCVRHARAWDASGVTSAGAMVLGILAAIVVALLTRVLFGLAVFVVATSLAWFVRTRSRRDAAALKGASCASAGLAVEYRGWTGTTHAFTFESPTFAARFAEQNTTRLANQTPQLTKLIEGYRKARLAVPTPALAVGVAPPPLGAREWLSRLEATEGTFARRVQLQRALDMIDDGLARRELIQTVARIELAPVIGKLQRTTSVAAKRRLLDQTIARVRDANLSDELQAAQLAQLEARLAELT